MLTMNDGTREDEERMEEGDVELMAVGVLGGKAEG